MSKSFSPLGYNSGRMGPMAKQSPTNRSWDTQSGISGRSCTYPRHGAARVIVIHVVSRTQTVSALRPAWKWKDNDFIFSSQSFTWHGGMSFVFAASFLALLRSWEKSDDEFDVKQMNFCMKASRKASKWGKLAKLKNWCHLEIWTTAN